MKFNDEVRNKYSKYSNKIYYDKKAKRITNKKNFKKISLMKQENIRVALKRKIDLSLIKQSLNSGCGYCFMNEFCSDCPLSCCKLPEWYIMRHARSYKRFSEVHKSWCKKLKLWKKEWSRKQMEYKKKVICKAKECKFNKETECNRNMIIIDHLGKCNCYVR